MKIILLDVMSVDGKLTKWSNGHSFEWTSVEEQENFREILSESTLYLMGSNVFMLSNIKPKPGKLKMVMTRYPEKYASLRVEGQLEFTNESPKELVARLERKGYGEMYLIAGPTLATKFFREGLIGELWLSIEPRIFGQGASMVSERMDLELELYSVKQLNKKGLLFLKYRVRK